MSALWEEYATTSTLSTGGTDDAQELFHNEVDDHVFASAPITIVDGIATVVCSTTNLVRVKLVVAHESFVAADIDALGRHEPQNWYAWMCAAGPLVWRLRSKRTILPEHKLWVHLKKVAEGDSTVINCGFEFLMVRHQ